MNRPDVIAAIASQRWMITAEGMQRILAQLPELDAGQFIGDLFAARPEAAASRSRPARSGSVAIVSIRGPIVRYDSWFTMLFGGTSVEWLGQQIREAAADEAVGSILLDVDSPGGTISGLPELAATIRAAREVKPVSAITNDYNCSAAYWLSAQADEISSTIEGLTGSVGVYTEHWDLSGMLALEGIGHEYIQAGRFKTEGNEFEPLAEEARTHFQGIVDDGYGLFVSEVAKGRGVTVAQVKSDYGEGRYFVAKDAKAKGLIDRIGSFADAVNRAATGKVSRRAMAPVEEIERTATADPVVAEPPIIDASAFEFEREQRRRKGLVTSARTSAGALVLPDRQNV
jgi:signal peptide peptidase SppA